MPSIDFFRDPIWQFYGAVIGIVGILVAVGVAFTIFWLQRSRKELAYRVVSETPLIKITGPYAGRIQITWDGRPVPDVSALVVRIANTGNKEIVASDYEEPISVSFPQSGSILTSDLNDANPTTLHPIVTINGSTASIAPCLLNRGDSMTFSFLVEAYAAQVLVSGRIAGISKIGGEARPVQLRRAISWLLWISFLVIVAVTYLWANGNMQQGSGENFPELPLLVLFGLSAIAVNLLSDILQKMLEGKYE